MMLSISRFFKPYFAAFWRDIRLTARKPGDWALPLLFFVIICSLFSMTYPYEPRRLMNIAPPVLWTSSILAILLSLENQFQSDFKEGSLEQFLLSPHSLSGFMLSKSLAHWVLTGVPLAIISPILGISLQLPSYCFLTLQSTLLVGTLLLSLLGSFAVLLTLGLSRGGIFLALLILPLTIPVLLLGVGSLYAVMQGLAWSGQMALLLALLLVALVLVPLAMAKALRISLMMT